MNFCALSRIGSLLISKWQAHILHLHIYFNSDLVSFLPLLTINEDSPLAYWEKKATVRQYEFSMLGDLVKIDPKHANSKAKFLLQDIKTRLNMCNLC